MERGTLGMAAACTGVGAVRPRFASARSNRGSRPVSSKVAIEGGKVQPLPAAPQPRPSAAGAASGAWTGRVT